MKKLKAIDPLGLNQFGRNHGMNPIFGALIGGGTAGGTTIILRQTGATKHPELFGLLTGSAMAGVLYAMRSTRNVAPIALVGAILASGLAWLEKTAFSVATLPVAPETKAAIAGMGIPQMRALGYPNARALNGMGLPAVSNVPHAAGAIPGVAGAQLAAPGGGPPPVSLMGQPSAAAVHLMGIGGPPVHGLSAAYGATLLGAGR